MTAPIEPMPFVPGHVMTEAKWKELQRAAQQK